MTDTPEVPETRRMTPAMTLMADIRNAHALVKQAFEHAHATNEATQQSHSAVREITSQLAAGLSALERALKLTA